MSAGYRGLAAPWVGGAGATPPGGPALTGFRSLLAPWLGGASAAPAVAPVEAGYRSLFALWAGGAGAALAVTPPGVSFGGSGPLRIPVDRLRLQQLADDELIAIVIAAALPLLH